MKKRNTNADASASDAAWPPLRLVDPIPPGRVTDPPPAQGSTDDDITSAVDGLATVPTVESEGPLAVATPKSAETSDATWLAAVDGGCPISHPVKANAQSGIFHVPGGRSYERTIPERCYATPEAAIADGYRQAKV